jgi:hypothetical protein
MTLRIYEIAHGAEFDHFKGLTAEAWAGLAEKHWRAEFATDLQGHEQKHWRQ